MSNETIPISPATRIALLDLAARTGRPAAEMLTVAVDEFRRRLTQNPITEIPGVDSADVWEAAGQAEAGRLSPHADVFARLRQRP